MLNKFLRLTLRKCVLLSTCVLMINADIVPSSPVDIVTVSKINGSDQSEGMCQGSDLDIVFVVDGSSSINPDNFVLVKTFMATLAEKFLSSERQAGTSVGMVQFSGVVRTEFSLNSNDQLDELLDNIRNVSHLQGTTKLGLALTHTKDKELVEDKGDRPDIPNLIVVITDGRSQDEPGPVAATLRDAENTIIAVGVTTNIDRNQLLSVAGELEAVFETSDFKLLDADLAADIANFVFKCNNSRKVILEKPLESSEAVINGNISSSSIVSSAETQPICPGSDIDLMFVVDGSSSIHKDRFELVKLFIATLVEKYLPMDQDSNSHVGMVQFSWSARTEFSLNHQAGQDELLDNIRNVSYLQGTTRLGMALSYTKDNELVKDKGDRPDVPNLIIVITDGTSRDEPGPTAASLRAEGTKMVVVGVTEDVDTDQLLSVAGEPDAVFNADSFESLKKELADVIVKYTC